MALAEKLLIQIPITVIAGAVFDFALQIQMKVMITAMRRVPYRFSYSVGPPLKILLLALCLTACNFGIAFPEAPDSLIGPAVLASAFIYAGYVWFLCGKAVGDRMDRA